MTELEGEGQGRHEIESRQGEQTKNGIDEALSGGGLAERRPHTHTHTHTPSVLVVGEDDAWRRAVKR